MRYNGRNIGRFPSFTRLWLVLVVISVLLFPIGILTYSPYLILPICVVIPVYLLVRVIKKLIAF